MRTAQLILAVILALVSFALPVAAHQALVTGPQPGVVPPFGKVLRVRGSSLLVKLTSRELAVAEKLGYDYQLVEETEPVPGPGRRPQERNLQAAAVAKAAYPVWVVAVDSPPAAAPGSWVRVPVSVRVSFGTPTSICTVIFGQTGSKMVGLTSATDTVTTGERRYTFNLAVPSGGPVAMFAAVTYYWAGRWVQCDTWRFPINTPAPEPHELVAVLVDQAIASQAMPLLQQYKAAVESSFNATLVLSSYSFANRREVRALLKQLYSQGYTGSIMVGMIPVPIWEFPWGDLGPVPLYYEDMDGLFYNDDHDAYLDRHTEGAHPGPDMWVAWMRPPSNEPGALIPYLSRCVSYYGGDNHRRQAFLHTNSDWGQQVGPIAHSLENIYDYPPVVQGGEGVYVSANTWLYGLSQGYGVNNIWVHSNSTYCRFDVEPRYLYWYQVPVAQGPLFTVVYGCHAGDFSTAPSGNFPLAYVIENPSGLAQMGVTRKVSTGTQEVLFNALASGRSLGRAYKDFIDFHYQPAWVRYWFPSDDPTRFVWDFALNGNPFMRFQ